MALIKNSLQVRLTGLIVGLVINAFGNALCISANMGSGIWTASAVNLNHWLGINVGVLLFLIGLANALTNQVLIHHWDWRRFVGEMGFILFFSYFVDFFSAGLTRLGVGQLPLLVRAILSCLGVAIFCVAISLYQRANIVMHPNDDTTNILRFMYVHENATVSQLIDFVPPILIILISAIFTHQVYAVNVGTVFSILFNGLMISTADRLVWPRLRHNFKAERNEM